MLAGGLAHLSPNVALLVLTLGVLLIYVELNRPGWVVPGAVGLMATLFAVASLARVEVNPGAVALVGTAVVLLGWGCGGGRRWMVAVAATLALVLGFAQLVKGPAGTAVGMWGWRWVAGWCLGDRPRFLRGLHDAPAPTKV